MTVIHRQTRNDADCINRHAQVGGIEFVAKPHQPYTARMGDMEASVDKYIRPNGRPGSFVIVWFANVYTVLSNGNAHFIDRIEDEDRDVVFEWAAREMENNQ